MAKEVIITADKIRKWRRTKRIINIALLVLLLLLIVVYIILRVTYSEGSFTVALEKNESLKSGLTLLESLTDVKGKRKIAAENIQFMDNISIKWLPKDIDGEYSGSHNGDNYIAFTFYLENQGKESINYWYNMVVDDVIKNVDEAIRIMIFVNGESTVYAKKNSLNGESEVDTTKFREDKDGTIILEQRTGLNPGDLDRITVVVFIEGSDPDCVNALLGGMLKMHMEITEEHVNNN